MKDSFYTIILSAVIIFLVGAMGFAFMSGIGKGVSVNLTSNPQNNADGGSPQVSNPQNDGQSFGASQKPDLIITKIIDYDDITTNGANLTASTSGEFIVDNLIIETGSVTMASGTLFQIFTVGDTYGKSTTLFSAGVNMMAKDKSYDFNTSTTYASSTQRMVLDDNSKLMVKCTGNNCKPSEVESGGSTGGFMRITAILKPLNSGSSLYE